MKLLLTGADGFTGKHFAQRAQQAGYEVIALRADLKDKEGLRSEIKQISPVVVVHLAAISFVDHEDVSAFYEVNVVGTTNLLDALSELSDAPRSVLLASSANVYGNAGQSPITEAQLPSPVNHYAMSKLAMEYMARTYLDRLPLFFVRPFNYTGPGQNEWFVMPKLVNHYARKEAVIELGNLKVEREFNDVRFVCESYLRLLEMGKSGEVYNVCSGAPVSLESAIALLANLTGYRPGIKVNQAFVRNNEVHRLSGNNAKLLATIGEVPIPALEETLHWMLVAAKNDSARL